MSKKREPKIILRLSEYKKLKSLCREYKGLSPNTHTFLRNDAYVKLFEDAEKWRSDPVHDHDMLEHDLNEATDDIERVLSDLRPILGSDLTFQWLPDCVKALKADAALGALVRQMPANCRLANYGNGWNVARIALADPHGTHDTPELALKAAGVGEQVGK